MTKQLNKHFSISLHGNVWRILAEPEKGRLAIEVREGEGRQVSFAAVDLEKNKLLWQDLTLPETWWLSAIALHQNILLLQTYPDSQTPQPKGLIAIEGDSGNTCWQQEQFSFSRLSSAGLVAHQIKDQLPEFYLLDLHTGQVIETLSDERLLSLSPIQEPSVLYPGHYTQENQHFGMLAAFIAQKLQVKAVKAFDYLEYKNLIILSYYVSENSTFTNKLVVLDQESNFLLHEVMATKLIGTGFDTFFVVNNHLIFVKEKKEIYSFEIP